MNFEKSYLSLFPCADEHENRKKFILLLVWSHIAREPGITLSKLKWNLNREFNFSSSVVEFATTALANKNMFHSISKFHAPDKKKLQDNQPIVYLRPLKDTSRIERWVLETLDANPELGVFL